MKLTLEQRGVVLGGLTASKLKIINLKNNLLTDADVSPIFEVTKELDLVELGGNKSTAAGTLVAMAGGGLAGMM